VRDRKSDTAHRRAAEAKLGRKLQSGEVVDHANEDKTDQSPANLSPMGRGEHTAHHNRTRPLGKLRRALRMPKEGKKLY
jgi:hypothetical protein